MSGALNTSPGSFVCLSSGLAPPVVVPGVGSDVFTTNLGLKCPTDIAHSHCASSAEDEGLIGHTECHVGRIDLHKTVVNLVVV